MIQEQKHRILREVLRHYIEFEDYCTQHGTYFIDYRGLTLSFLDLQGALEALSPRKKEAVTLNVIYDMKQKDVAAIMGITTVSVGQYVEQAMIQVAKKYFAEDEGGSKDDVQPLHNRSPRPSPHRPKGTSGASQLEVPRVAETETVAVGILEG